MVLYSKACQKCDSVYKRGKETEDCEFPKNFEGNSKSMEAAKILKVVKSTFHDFCFIIDVIVSNNDGTMRAMLQQSSIGA